MNLSFRRAARLWILAFIPVILSGCAVNNESLVSIHGKYANSYAVVVSRDTYADPEWKTVADALAAKHMASLIVHEGSVANCKADLAQRMPRYTGFVARPGECGRDYVAEVHRLTRRLDDDPWLDTQWGIITGADAQAALRVVQSAAPLTAKRALATTGLNADLFEEYFLLSDANPPGNWQWKKTDGTVVRGKDNLGKNDAFAWAEQFESSAPDLIVTSAHGFESGVEMPFSRGIVRVVDGQLYPVADYRQKKPEPDTPAIAESNNPKVYFPVGNCLIGHVNGQHCMVTAMMGNYGVKQMAGYTVDTWFGRGGWDMLSLWQTLPGRNSFSESFFFNQQAMLRDIAEIDPCGLEYQIKLGTGEVHLKQHLEDMVAAGLKFDARNLNPRSNKNPDTQLVGLLWDIDTVAFYGDPAWKAVLDSDKAASFTYAGVTSSNDTHTFSMDILDPAAAIQNNTPIGVIFTTRLRNPKLISGSEYHPILADNFLLLLNPRPRPGEKEIVVKFEGERIED